MIAPVSFTDLDDTLFQTQRKCPDGTADGLALMSTLIDGSPSGYATKRQQNLLGWLRAGTVIPVTARSTEVLTRVNIERTPSISSNGGCILAADGSVDAEWHSQLQNHARREVSIEETYSAMTHNLSSESFRHWMVSEHGLPLYIVIKSNDDDVNALHELGASLADQQPEGWRQHANGNNLAFLPRWLNKRHAVAYLIETIRAVEPDTPIIGIGDSNSDVGFMDLCDFAMTPTQSQLWKTVASENDWCK